MGAWITSGENSRSTSTLSRLHTLSESRSRGSGVAFMREVVRRNVGRGMGGRRCSSVEAAECAWELRCAVIWSREGARELTPFSWRYSTCSTHGRTEGNWIDSVVSFCCKDPNNAKGETRPGEGRE